MSELWALDEDRFGMALGRAEYVKWALGWKKPFSWEDGYVSTDMYQYARLLVDSTLFLNRIS